jgi:predicted metal-dependent hydrolase
VIFGLASAIEYFARFWKKVDLGIKLRRRNELLALERQKQHLQRIERKKDRLEKKGKRRAAAAEDQHETSLRS